MKQSDKLRKLAAELREESRRRTRRKKANTAHTASAMLGLQHFKRILGLPSGDDQ